MKHDNAGYGLNKLTQQNNFTNVDKFLNSVKETT